MKRYLCLVLLLVLLLVVVLPFCALAEETYVADFDGTSVIEDLSNATVLNKKFNIAEYPLNEDGTPELLAFTEFAFTYFEEYKQSYGLYLYVYYPQGNLKEYVQNTVEMAVTYDNYGEPTAWHKFHIKLLSTDGNKVLYKFKIVDTEGYTLNDVYNRVGASQYKTGERRYDINSIELRANTATNATDYGIGGTWTLSGFSKGLNSESMDQSTLKSVAKYKDTLKLDVHSTYYRTWQTANNDIADQLSSVYFSVPNKIDKQYDELYAIDFDAYKYLSSPIFCIHDDFRVFVNSFLVDFDQVYTNLYNQLALGSYGIDKLTEYTWLTWDSGEYDYLKYYEKGNVYVSTTTLSTLGWVLKVKHDEDYLVSSETLLTYMKDFSNKFGKDVRDTYNKYLFSDKYYTSRYDIEQIEYGKNIGTTIKSTDENKLIGTSSKTNLWNVLKLVFTDAYESELKFNPIQEVSYTDIKSLDEDAISEKYLVAKADVSDFVDYVKSESEKDKTIYLFRFDVDTYYTSELQAETYGVCGYMAQEPIYLDFDIISLTYEKDGVYTVIPVVSDPINIIAGVEPGGDLGGIDIDNWMQELIRKIATLLLTILVVVIVVRIVFALLKWLFNGNKGGKR